MSDVHASQTCADTNKLDCPHALGTNALSSQRAESFRHFLLLPLPSVVYHGRTAHLCAARDPGCHGPRLLPHLSLPQPEFHARTAFPDTIVRAAQIRMVQIKARWTSPRFERKARILRADSTFPGKEIYYGHQSGDLLWTTGECCLCHSSGKC